MLIGLQHPDPSLLLPHPLLPRPFLTLNFKVHGLGVLTNGVAGSADVLSSICVLDALQGQGGHTSMAADHHVSIQSLPGGKDSIRV